MISLEHLVRKHGDVTMCSSFEELCRHAISAHEKTRLYRFSTMIAVVYPTGKPDIYFQVVSCK